MKQPLHYIDDIGKTIFYHPMTKFPRPSFHILNFFDDMGIFLVCRPLRYLHRFAAFLLDVDLDADESAIDT